VYDPRAEINTSTSICLTNELSESKSPVGIHWCPCITPVLIVHDRHRQRERRLVIVALDDVPIGRYGPQIVVHLLVADVARSEDLLNFTWDEEFLEFEGEVVNPVRDVEVTNDEDEDHCGRWQTCFVER